MGRFIDLTGRKFGRLTVLNRAAAREGSKCTFWNCVCECGAGRVIDSADLRKGRTTSCGCYRAELCAKHGRASKKHGYAKTSLYDVWMHMKRRCYDPNAKGYHRYGGRGIEVCDEWRDNVDAFVQWAEANGYQRGLEIDREDNDGNYTPENCRWVTKIENVNNKGNNVNITVDGITKTLTQWAVIIGVRHNAINDYRRRHGDASVPDYIKKKL